MTDDMIPVPRALIERLDAILDGPDRTVPALDRVQDEFRALIPKPPAPRPRMVDLDVLTRHVRKWGDLPDLESKPDALAVIERVVRTHPYPIHEEARLLARITAALTEGEDENDA